MGFRGREAEMGGLGWELGLGGETTACCGGWGGGVVRGGVVGGLGLGKGGRGGGWM